MGVWSNGCSETCTWQLLWHVAGHILILTCHIWFIHFNQWIIKPVKINPYTYCYRGNTITQQNRTILTTVRENWTNEWPDCDEIWENNNVLSVACDSWPTCKQHWVVPKMYDANGQTSGMVICILVKWTIIKSPSAVLTLSQESQIICDELWVKQCSANYSYFPLSSIALQSLIAQKFLHSGLKCYVFVMSLWYFHLYDQLLFRSALTGLIMCWQKSVSLAWELGCSHWYDTVAYKHMHWDETPH